MKSRFRLFMWPMLFSLTCHGAVASENPDESIRTVWIRLSQSELARLEEEDRAFAAQYLALAFTGIDELELATEVSHKYLSPREQNLVTMFIAVAEAKRGRLEAAYETIGTLPTKELRQTALSIVASRLASFGDVKTAETVLDKITQADRRDGAIEMIVKAHVAAGDPDGARAWARRIAEKARRARVADQIEDGRLSIPSIRPPWLKDQIAVILEFSRSAGVREALAAIESAQAHHSESFSKHFKTASALAAAEKTTALDKATIRTLLAVALVETRQQVVAREMIMSAKAAGDDEWVGVSSLFGNPVLIYLLVRLDLEDELNDVTRSLAESDAIAAEIIYLSAIQAVGSSYASLNRMGDAKKYFDHLESPLERVHFAVGVFAGLERESSR